MFDWLKKLHMYAGLVSFTAFIVWGVTGIGAVFLPSPGNWRPAPVSDTRFVAFDAPGDLDDKALAVRVFEASGLTMARPPNQARRDNDANLSFVLYTPNGRRDVTYLETERRIRIEVRQNNLAGFLSAMHAGSSRRGPPDWPARVWGYYNEFATWAFCFMTLTGLYLWLATRPRLAWAWLTFGGASAAVAALWVATR
ncbi:MAG: PepSY domain-containing protein [Bryobacterales bacterium]|nr:PepSY domain-containing protein [Bryobacterales bacterium]